MEVGVLMSLTRPILRAAVAPIPRVGLEMLYDVSSWTGVSLEDTSGNNRDATQPAGNSRPSVQDAMNGRPAMVFDGLNDSLILPRLDLSAATVVACFAKAASVGQPYGTLLQIIQSSSTRDALLLQVNDSTTDGPVLLGADGSGAAGYQIGGSLSLNTPRLLIASLSAGAFTAWDGDSSVALSASTVKAAAAAGSDSRIGGAWSSPSGSVYRHFAGAIGVLAVYSRVLSADERAAWVTHCRARGWLP